MFLERQKETWNETWVNVDIWSSCLFAQNFTSAFFQ